MERDAADELALRASIAFAKGMDRVDLAEVVARTLGEGISVEALQVLLRLEGREERFKRGKDELWRRKAEGIRARSRDLAEIARPGKDVLKDVAVDQAQVAYVKIAGKRLFFKLGYAEKRETRDVGFELGCILDA